MRMEFPNLPENVAFARTTVAVFASQLDFTLDELDEIKWQHRKQYPTQ